MSVKKSVNICVFGLSLRALNDLKSQIERLVAHQTTINWKNISEPNLDALFINDIFFDTPSIQNLVKTNQFNVLKLATKADKHSVIEGDTLFLPVVNTTYFEKWFEENVLSTSSGNKTNSNSHVGLKTTTPDVSNASQYDVKDKLAVLKDLFNPQNGKALVFDQRGQLGLLDPRSERFWANPDNTAVKVTDYSLNFTFAKMNDTLKYNQVMPQDMKFWMFNLLWNSPDFAELAPQDGYFKIKYWPQPHNEQDRRDILRLTACFARGAEIGQVAKHLNLPVSKVRQFVAAALGADLIQQIESSKASFSTKNTEQSVETQGAIRKFFGGLRRRLGL